MNSPSRTNGTNRDGITYNGGVPVPRSITKHVDTTPLKPRKGIFIGRAATSMEVISSQPTW